MKKFISTILAVLMLCSLVIPVYSAGNETDELHLEAYARVSGLGIIKGDDGGLRMEDNITRAEFITIACRLMSMDNIPKCESGFSDVSSFHWASGYVAAARNLGITNGVGNNEFAPEANITYSEILKMLVSVLGYTSQAEAKGGWPNGYLAQASILGLTKDADMSEDTAIRGEVAVIINNALDVKPLEPDYGSNEGYKVSEDTLYDRLSDIADTVEFEGIYQENPVSSVLTKIPACEDGTIIIEGKEYKSNDLYSELLGKAVKGVAKEYKNNKYEIVSIYELDSENNVTVIDTDDGYITESYGVLYKDNGGETRIKISDSAVYLYNGRKTDKVELYRNLDEAIYTLIDNTGDRTADIIMIEEGESFVVDRVSEKSSSVYFENGITFKGKRGISLIPDENLESSFVYLMDKDGVEVAPADVCEDSVITVNASEDMSLYTIRVSFDTAEGTVESLNDESIVEIAGNEYKSLVDLSVGEEGIFAIDYLGRIAGKLEDTADMNYGYIINAGSEGGLNSELKVEILTGGTPQKKVKNLAGTEKISYDLQNEESKIFTCRSRVKFNKNDTTGFGSGVLCSDIKASELIGTVCAYRLDSDGKISHLNVYDVIDNIASCTFNAKIFSFGGTSSSRGFATNDNTQVICIPSDVESMDDYGVLVNIADNAKYNVYGVKAISENAPDSKLYKSEEVDVLIVKTAMKSSVLLPILEDADICIIGNISKVSDSDGDVIEKITLLNGENKLVLTVDSDNDLDGIVSELRLGDLVKYRLDGKGNIANIKKLASVQGLNSYDASDNYYGICEDISYGIFDNIRNDYVDEILVSFDGVSNDAYVKLEQNAETAVNVYLYNRRLGSVESADTDDIVTRQQSGNAHKIFALMDDNGDVVSVVLIED